MRFLPFQRSLRQSGKRALQRGTVAERSQMMRNARAAGGTLRSAGNSAVPERGLSTLQRARAQAQENIFNATKAAPRGPSAAGRARSNRPTAVGRSDPVNKENMMSQAGPIARKAGSIKSSSSKDSLDSNGQSREQRKARPGLCQAPTVATQTPECGSGEKASPTTILQQEREKALLEQQVSELVRNAESKKAEIATLRMEIKHLKEDRASGDRWQLEALQEENRRLRDKLLQMGAPIEQSPLSDSDKEQLLLGRSASGSMASLDGAAAREQAKSTEGALSDADVGESSPGGARLEWDKASTSSLSEMSVACLQDRIMQMEETHYSTNEELQATLQELTDLQDQLTDLQLENERCGDEKSLLLESLCSQTEKLEECRSQNEHLRVLLFQQACPREQPREHHYVELLKKSHEEQQCLRGRVEQLESALEGANREAQDHQRDLGSLAHRVSLLQAALDATHPPLLGGGGGTRPPSRSTEDEQQQRKRAEEEEEEERQREQGLQEQLALAQREATRLSELLSQVQDETQAAHAQVSSLEQRVEQLESEKAQLMQECEAKCQRQLEDKRQLRAQVGELQNRLADTSALLGAARRDLQDLRSKHLLETEEWKQFEVDLLTTVRVANDFKTESQQDVERLQCDNQQLQEKLEALEAQLAKLKQQNRQQELSPKAPLPERGEEGAPPEATPHGASPLRKPLGSRWGDLRPSSSSSSAQHSVRSLIESIENATKQAKGAASFFAPRPKATARTHVGPPSSLRLGSFGPVLTKVFLDGIVHIRIWAEVARYCGVLCSLESCVASWETLVRVQVLAQTSFLELLLHGRAFDGVPRNLDFVRLCYCATEALSWARGGASASAASMTSLLWNAQTGEACAVAAERAAAVALARQLCARTPARRQGAKACAAEPGILGSIPTPARFDLDEHRTGVRSCITTALCTLKTPG
ncbi:hypothetical protein HPB47_027720 [Ixodes persulcatus]|uniref:Uncharacterized protein n=1 Tax=Ixodes persulcatus TaxID=34615 RepID=A0AC60PV60_IXOPE|nr:hypothetical protein HPB47_027720 [Ixodes persulcatus]